MSELSYEEIKTLETVASYCTCYRIKLTLNDQEILHCITFTFDNGVECEYSKNVVKVLELWQEAKRYYTEET